MKLKINVLVEKQLLVLALLVPALLAGCEPPLVLEGVEKERAKAARRSDDFQSMAYNGSSIVVVGARGAVVTSKDEGQSWFRTVLENKPFLMAVDDCPDGSFVAVDYSRNLWILESVDAEWQQREIETAETPQVVTCDNQGRVWVAGSFSTILRSDDRGQSWSENLLDRDLYYTTIQFLDKDHGMLTGEFGAVTRTTDGGDTWEMLNPIPDDFYPHDAWFESAQRGWVAGLNGTVFYTEDAGETWQSQETGTRDPIHSIVGDKGSLYAVGSNGLILTCPGCITGQSDSGGWQTVEHDLPVRFYLRGVAPVNGKLWVAGGSGALHSVKIADGNDQRYEDKTAVLGGAK